VFPTNFSSVWFSKTSSEPFSELFSELKK